MDAPTHYSLMAVEAMSAKLDQYTGRTAKPQRGCQFARLTLGEADVLVEYETEGPSGDGWHEPHYPATLTIIQVLINGTWVDAEDTFAGHVITKWEAEIGEQFAEQAAADADAEAESIQADRLYWASINEK